MVGSLWGKRKTLHRLVLGWSVVVAFFLINYSAMKNYQYMLPFMMPLFLGALMFPSLTDGGLDPNLPAIFRKPLTGKFLRAVTILVVVAQFVINCDILIPSPLIR